MTADKLLNSPLENGFKALLTVLHTSAIGLTGWRYYSRWRTGRLWLDDYSALVSTLLDLGFFIHLWVETTLCRHDIYTRALPVFWMKMIFFLGSLWASRMSITMSIVRLAPRLRTNLIAYSILGVLGATAIGLITWTGVECTSNRRWYITQWKQCQMSTTLASSILSAHVVVDLFLVITPLVLFWRVKLPRRQRRLILGGFCASMISSLSTGITMGFQLSRSTWGGQRWHLTLFVAHIETSVSLLVCNFLILVAAFYRWRHGDDDESDSDSDSEYTTTSCETTSQPTSATRAVERTESGSETRRHTSQGRTMMSSRFTLTQISSLYDSDFEGSAQQSIATEEKVP